MDVLAFSQPSAMPSPESMSETEISAALGKRGDVRHHSRRPVEAMAMDRPAKRAMHARREHVPNQLFQYSHVFGVVAGPLGRVAAGAVDLP